MLGWAGRYQGGAGAYRTDGPEVYDVVAGAVALPEAVHQKREERKCGSDGH
jgi:hypothetical protein